MEYLAIAETFAEEPFLKKLSVSHADLGKLINPDEWEITASSMLPITRRLSCARILGAFRPLMNQIAQEPEEGWLSFVYQTAVNRLYFRSDPTHTDHAHDGYQSGGQYMLGCTADPTLCYIATAILAVGMCMTALMSPLLTAPLFGYRSFATVNGIFMAMCSLATIFSNPISNNCFDVTGSYTPAFRGAALVNGVVLVLYLVLFALTKREKRRYFEEHPEEK